MENESFRDDYTICLRERKDQKCSCGFKFKSFEDDDNSYPLILPCYHSLCKECVTKNLNNRTIICPECTRKHYIGKDAMSMLPKDFANGDLQRFKCNRCRGKATHYCEVCKEHICQGCYKRHNLDHQIIEIHEFQIRTQIKRRKCKKHKDKSLTYFCPSCEETICDKCKYKDHQKHKIINMLDTASNAYLYHILSIIEDLNPRLGKDIKNMEDNLNLWMQKSRTSNTDNELENKENENGDVYRTHSIYSKNNKRLHSMRDYMSRLKRGQNIAIQNLKRKEYVSEYISLNLQCLVIEYERFQTTSESQSMRSSEKRNARTAKGSKRQKRKVMFDAFDESLRRTYTQEDMKNLIQEKRTHFDKRDCPVLQITYRFETEEFPSLDYLSRETGAAIQQLKPVIPHIIDEISRIENSSKKTRDKSQSRYARADIEKDTQWIYQCVDPERLPQLRYEIRETGFTVNNVYVNIVGDVLESNILESLRASTTTKAESLVENAKARHAKKEQSEKYGVYAVNVCWLTTVNDHFESEVNDFLMGLPKNSLKNVVFVTNDNHIIILDVLFHTFPKVFKADQGKHPICATVENLWKIVADMLMEIMSERLDTLISVLNNCLLQSNQSDDVSCEKRTILEEGLIDARSILQEIPRRRKEMSKLQCVGSDINKLCGRDIYDKLRGLKDKGVKACCVIDGELLIFVSNHARNWEHLLEQIKDIVSGSVDNCAVLRTKWPIVQPLISNGDKIYPEDLLPDDKYGTLGSFAEADSQLVALTSGHVALKDKNIFTMDKELFGKCKAVTNPNVLCGADIAVIEVESKIQENCDRYFKAEDNKAYDLYLFKEGKSNLLKGQRVHKIGAKTAHTRGVIVSTLHDFEQIGDYVIVEGRDGMPFADGGDSGSVVYKRDLDDSDQLTALAMVAGGNIELREMTKDDFVRICGDKQSSAEDVNNKLQKCSCTFMLSEAFDDLKTRQDIKLELISKNKK